MLWGPASSKEGVRIVHPTSPTRVGHRQGASQDPTPQESTRSSSDLQGGLKGHGEGFWGGFFSQGGHSFSRLGLVFSGGENNFSGIEPKGKPHVIALP